MDVFFGVGDHFYDLNRFPCVWQIFRFCLDRFFVVMPRTSIATTKSKNKNISWSQYSPFAPATLHLISKEIWYKEFSFLEN